MRPLNALGGGFISSEAGSLFAVTSYTGNTSSLDVVTGQKMTGGALVIGRPSTATSDNFVVDTKRGGSARLVTNATAAENTVTARISSFNSDGFTATNAGDFNGSVTPYVAFTWLIEAGFMDVVTHSGNGTTQNISHSLGVTPSMIATKVRSVASGWRVWHEDLSSGSHFVSFNTDAPESTSGSGINATSSQFTADTSLNNSAGETYINYLFAAKSGKSAAGAYTGTTTINTGLSSIKAILVKRTDSTGDWYLFYNDGGTWYHVKPNTPAARATGLISATGGDVTLSGAASSGNGIYMAWT